MRLAWPGVVLIGGIGGAIAVVFILWFAGCAVRSVDEGDYVAHNEAVYKALPQYPGATLINSYSIGIPKPGGLNDNGPPYSAFDTWHVYRLPPSVQPEEVISHFLNLSAGWGDPTSAPNGNQLTLRKGNALIYVVASKSGYEMSVDYDGYGGPGH